MCDRATAKTEGKVGPVQPGFRAPSNVLLLTIPGGSSEHSVKLKLFFVFSDTNCDIFLIFAQNIDCGYTLEPPHCGGSNEYPQSMF